MRPFVVFVIVTLLLVGSIGLVLHLARGTGPARFGVAGAMTFAGLGSFLLAPPQRDEAAPPIRLSGADQYVTSQACRSCHPSEYESWRKTYHRTMTRAARATSADGVDGGILVQCNGSV